MQIILLVMMTSSLLISLSAAVLDYIRFILLVYTPTLLEVCRVMQIDFGVCVRRDALLNNILKNKLHLKPHIEHQVRPF